MGYALQDALRLELYGGAMLGEIRLKDKNGKKIREKDIDPAPVVGFSLNAAF